MEEHQHISIYYPDGFSSYVPLTIETLDKAIAKNDEIFGGFEEVTVDFSVFENQEQFMDFKSCSCMNTIIICSTVHHKIQQLIRWGL